MKKGYGKQRFRLLLLLLAAGVAVSAQKATVVTIVNPLSLTRVDELIVLKRGQLEAQLGKVADGVQVRAGGLPVAVQHDDINGDGAWDELVFLYSFAPRQTVRFSLFAGNGSRAASPRAHVRLRKKNNDDNWGPNLKKETMPFQNPATDFSKQPLPLYLTEGPGWENDKLAFRLYFDVRNGKDIFAKRTSRMVLDSVGTKVRPSYHDLNDWGMDVLHAGKSLGSGALALWIPNENRTDTLMRLGGKNIKNTVYEQLADGPLRALFRISYEWNVAGKPVRLAEEISIWGGQYFYESKVTVHGAPKGAKLVTGIASFYNNVFQSFAAGKAQILMSHGKQSENKDNLGMAVVVPQQAFAFAGSAPNEGSDILNTYLMAQNLVAGQPAVYRFYAGWELTDSRFQSLSYFKSFLQNEARAWRAPVTINW